MDLPLFELKIIDLPMISYDGDGSNDDCVDYKVVISLIQLAFVTVEIILVNFDTFFQGSISWREIQGSISVLGAQSLLKRTNS